MLDDAERVIRFKIREIVFRPRASPFRWEFIQYSPFNYDVQQQQPTQAETQAAATYPDIHGETASVPTTATHVPLRPQMIRCIDIREENKFVKTFKFETKTPPNNLPGQFATFELNIQGKRIIRTWTVSSVPKSDSDCSLAITVKRLPHGIASNWLHDELHIADEIKLKLIDGEFSPFSRDSPERFQRLLLLAGGIGITPLMSMMRGLFVNNIPCDVSLIFSARSAEDIIFRQELDEMATRQNCMIHYTVTQPDSTWRGCTGRINAEMIMTAAPDLKRRVVFMCGPPLFLKDMSVLLAQLGLPSENLRLERFDF